MITSGNPNFALANALFGCMYSTGCRIGEVVKLNRDDINFRTNSAIVHCKGDKEREVYFNTPCSIWLERYLDERDDKQTGLFITDVGQKILLVALRY